MCHWSGYSVLRESWSSGHLCECHYLVLLSIWLSQRREGPDWVPVFHVSFPTPLSTLWRRGVIPVFSSAVCRYFSSCLSCSNRCGYEWWTSWRWVDALMSFNWGVRFYAWFLVLGAGTLYEHSFLEVSCHNWTSLCGNTIYIPSVYFELCLKILITFQTFREGTSTLTIRTLRSIYYFWVWPALSYTGWLLPNQYRAYIVQLSSHSHCSEACVLHVCNGSYLITLLVGEKLFHVIIFEHSGRQMTVLLLLPSYTDSPW